MRNFNLISRQAALGPPAEAPFVPYPFEELAGLMPKTATRPSGEGKIQKPAKDTGLRQVMTYGEEIPVADQDYLDEYDKLVEARKEELATKIAQNPHQLGLEKEIREFSTNVRTEKEHGNYAQIVRNAQEVELVRAKKKKDPHNTESWWRYNDIENKLGSYALERADDPGGVPQLNLKDNIVAVPNHVNRLEFINKNMTALFKADKESIDQLLSGSGTQIVPIEGQEYLVEVKSKGVSNKRISNIMEAIFNSPEMSTDINSQLDGEQTIAELSGLGFDRDKREGEIKKDLIQNYAQSKYAGFTTARKVSAEKKGTGFNFSFGSASSKNWNYTYSKSEPDDQRVDWGALYPGINPSVIDALIKANTGVVERVRMQRTSTEAENKPISITVDKEGNRENLIPIQWQRKKGEEWMLLVIAEAKDENDNVIGTELKEIPNKYAWPDIKALTGEKDDSGMTIERFLKESGVETEKQSVKTTKKTTEPIKKEEKPKYEKVFKNSTFNGEKIDVGLLNEKYYNINTGKILPQQQK